MSTARSAGDGADRQSELVLLQQTLYTSRNPTRRWLHTSRYQWICEALARYGSGGSALEVGPGSGIYLPVLSAGFSEVTAVDIENEYLEGLAHLIDSSDNVRVQIDDITQSSFPDNRFDLVLCSEVIEHIADSARALQEMHRILKPGGVLILSTPQPLSPLELAARIAFLPGIKQIVRLIYREPLLPLGHINLLCRGSLQAQLSRAELDIVESHTGGVYLPGFSEFFGEYAVSVQKRLERALTKTWLRSLLWTQYYVLRAQK